MRTKSLGVFPGFFCAKFINKHLKKSQTNPLILSEY